MCFLKDDAILFIIDVRLILQDYTMKKSGKAAIYCRVSTSDQTTDNQLLELEKAAERQGWTVEAVYTETISGAATKRPQLDALMGSVMRKEIDVVMAWDVSRLGRSLQHLITLLSDIHSKDVGLYLHQQGVDTTTPSGKAMFSMMGVFAEFERAMVQERVKAGLERAKAQGKRLGRPPIPPIKIAKIKELRQQGLSMPKIAKRMGVSVGKVHAIVT
jgi:DNA invertase Pin-like site-specific DNA recombinase